MPNLLIKLALQPTHKRQRMCEVDIGHDFGIVMLVDDEKMVLVVGQEMLEDLGFQVLTADSGEKAVRIFRERFKEISCVLVDVVMPGMDGMETFAEMKRICSAKPVLFCSGYSTEQLAQRFNGPLPADFIEKPFKLKILAAKLREVLKATQAD